MSDHGGMAGGFRGISTRVKDGDTDRALAGDCPPFWEASHSTHQAEVGEFYRWTLHTGKTLVLQVVAVIEATEPAGSS